MLFCVNVNLRILTTSPKPGAKSHSILIEDPSSLGNRIFGMHLAVCSPARFKHRSFNRSTGRCPRKPCKQGEHGRLLACRLNENRAFISPIER